MTSTSTKQVDLEEEQFSYVKELLDSTAGTFKWPDKVVLYCLPPEQELLVDRASRLVFQTYLHLSKLHFTVKTAANASNMSPDGTTPLLVFQFRHQPMIWTKFEQLVRFLTKQGIGVGNELEDSDRVDQEAYLSLLRMRILPAQQYQTWANWSNLNETFAVNGRGLSWPFGPIIPCLSLFSYVWNYWSEFTRPPAEVLKNFEMACDALSQRLGKEEYFFKTRLTVLDVTVYGYLQAILTMHLPSPELIKIVQQHENLTTFCQRMSQQAPEVVQTGTIPPVAGIPLVYNT